jgi:hypothetical protein
MGRTIPTLLAVVLSACSSGASLEEATSATCRDIERWSGELQDVLAEDKDHQATGEALTNFQQSLQADADMFREAGKETVAARIDDWELFVGRLTNGQARGFDFRSARSYPFADDTQDALEAVKASVSCDGTGGT